MLRTPIVRLLRKLRESRLWKGLDRQPEAAGKLRSIRAPQAPLPTALADRLREIPHREILCRDLEREAAELLRGELPAARAAGLRGHLETCRRCSGVVTVLEAAVAAPPRPLPGRLAFRLHALARRPGVPQPLPPFLRDSRYALAAAAALALVLTTAAGGDPAALAVHAVDTTTARAREGGAILVEPVHAAWSWAAAQRRDLESSASRLLASGWEKRRRTGERMRRSLEDHRQAAEAEARELAGSLPDLLPGLAPDLGRLFSGAGGADPVPGVLPELPNETPNQVPPDSPNQANQVPPDSPNQVPPDSRTAASEAPRN